MVRIHGDEAVRAGVRVCHGRLPTPHTPARGSRAPLRRVPATGTTGPRPSTHAWPPPTRPASPCCCCCCCRRCLRRASATMGGRPVRTLSSAPPRCTEGSTPRSTAPACGIGAAEHAQGHALRPCTSAACGRDDGGWNKLTYTCVSQPLACLIPILSLSLSNMMPHASPSPEDDSGLGECTGQLQRVVEVHVSISRPVHQDKRPVLKRSRL